MAEQKAQFRDELESFVKKQYQTKLSSLNDKQRSEALLLCYMAQVRNALLPGSVPEEFDELRSHVCDNGGDRFVDFIYRDDSSHVTIVQAKYRSKDKGEDESHFDSFRKCLEKLCPETRGTLGINQVLLDHIADVDWENDTFTLLFLSLTKASKAIEESAQNGIDDVPSTVLADINTRSEIRYLSEEEINKDWRDVLGQSAGQSPEVKIMLTPPSENAKVDYLEVRTSSDVKTLMCVLSAGQIHQLYNRYRDKLFNMNIRNYIGDTRTNKGIIQTALEEPANFFLYNNGVSSVCSSITVTKDEHHTYLNCKDFSIINGAQTFRSISKAYTKQSADTKKLSVMLRVAEIDYRKSVAAEILDNITKYNNTQNSMRVSDFRSNDAVQSSLVKYIAQVPAFGGKSFVYRNKRTQTTERGKIAIRMDDFCRSVFAFFYGPADFFGGLSFLYDTGSDGGYVKLFGKELAALSQKEFERFFGAWLITSYGGELLKAEKAKESDAESEGDDIRRLALERKHLVFFAIGEVFREIAKNKKVEECELIASFSKPRWMDEDAKKRIVEEAFYVACDMVVQAYQMANAKQVIHRNFFRDSETLASIRSALISRRSQISRLHSLQEKGK